MACTLATVQDSACTSGIGKLNSRVELLQTVAQLLADSLNVSSPSTDTSVEAILDRACTSGIAKLNDEIRLLRAISQLYCDQQE